jgi:hypothetical protein
MVTRYHPPLRQVLQDQGADMRARWVVLVTVVIAAAAGCRTTEPVWFIATPGYVEAQLATREHALRREYDDRIHGLEHEMELQRRISNEMADLARAIRDVEAENRELQVLAAEFERAIRDLPADTIQAIVDALTGYLESPAQ